MLNTRISNRTFSFKADVEINERVGQGVRFETKYSTTALDNIAKGLEILANNQDDTHVDLFLPNGTDIAYLGVSQGDRTAKHGIYFGLNDTFERAIPATYDRVKIHLDSPDKKSIKPKNPSLDLFRDLSRNKIEPNSSIVRLNEAIGGVRLEDIFNSDQTCGSIF